jgi:hypothetical protein
MSSAPAEFLAKLRSDSNPAGVNHLQFFLLCLAGWVNRNQQNAIGPPAGDLNPEHLGQRIGLSELVCNGELYDKRCAA